MFKRSRVALRIGRLPSLALAFACVVAVLAEALPTAGDAAPASNQLRRVNGTVAFQTAGSTEHTIFGKQDLPDGATAITKAASVGELALPDSSIVTIGADTIVDVGEFKRTTDGPGATIFIKNGTVRFDIKRPAGGRANYIFVTQTSQIAVRGTVGHISYINGTTTVECESGFADSVASTTGAQTTSVLPGQILTIPPIGPAVPGALTPEVSAQFARSGVNVTAGGSSAGSTVVGITAGALGAGAIAATIIANNPTAAPAATAVAVVTPTPIPITLITPTPPPSTPTPGPTATPAQSATSTPTPTPAPTATATPTATPTKTPTPGPTATPTSSGNVNLTGGRRSQTHDGATPAAATPGAAMPAPVVRPTIAPPDIPTHPIR